MSAQKLAPVLKYSGAKWNLSSWITSHMPPHEVYVEPFFGSGAIFFRKEPARLEVICDLDDRVCNLFRVIREQKEELAAAIEMTPWSRSEYLSCYKLADDPVEDARRFLVRCWQAHGIKLFHRTGWRSAALPTNRGRSYIGDWSVLPQRILDTAARLQEAEIENRHFREVLPRYRWEGALIYADPPYLLPSSNAYYRHKMSVEEHEELLELLAEHPGPALVSNYRNTLYKEALKEWSSVSRTVRAEKGREREEVLWVNPVARERIEGRLFTCP